MSYSTDLRERAVKYVQDGGLHSKACEIFSISRKTLYNWLTREDLAPKKTRTGFKRKLDKEALAKHVEEHPDALLRERAVHFGVRVNSIWVALGVLKISKKTTRYKEICYQSRINYYRSLREWIAKNGSQNILYFDESSVK